MWGGALRGCRVTVGVQAMMPLDGTCVRERVLTLDETQRARYHVADWTSLALLDGMCRMMPTDGIE